MIIERNKINGMIIISDIINNQRVHKQFMGYSLAECKRLFKQYIKTL